MVTVLLPTKLSAAAETIQFSYPERTGVILAGYSRPRPFGIKKGVKTHVNGAAEAVSVAALIVVLAWAVRWPRDWPEAVAAVPAAGVAAIGAVTPHAALTEARQPGPVVGMELSGR